MTSPSSLLIRRPIENLKLSKNLDKLLRWIIDKFSFWSRRIDYGSFPCHGSFHSPQITKTIVDEWRHTPKCRMRSAWETKLESLSDKKLGYRARRLIHVSETKDWSELWWGYVLYAVQINLIHVLKCCSNWQSLPGKVFWPKDVSVSSSGVKTSLGQKLRSNRQRSCLGEICWGHLNVHMS